MRELTAAKPDFSVRTAAVVRARLRAAVPEMIGVIESGVPGYAEPEYQRRLASAVMGAVAQFIGQLWEPGGSSPGIRAQFRAIGFTAAREGRTLDALQNALRLGARVAWRGLCEADAGLDLRELSRVGEAIFGYLDELAGACAQGYEEACTHAAGERERSRQRLLNVIVADPPRSELVAPAATAAGWVLPSRVCVVVQGEFPPSPVPLLPADVLADWARPEPCLVVPDPDGPGRAAAIDRALRGRPAAIGPVVPLARAAWSLRWARQALALAGRGVIAAETGPVHCQEHLPALLLLADEDLARTLRATRLAPLDRVRPGQRDRLAETMLAWLQLGENAAEVAHWMHVHPQTVRYRLRQIQELFGDELRDPDRRFELQLALRVRALLAEATPPG